ncbi:MAG: hypothetical protein ACI9HK_003691 [Pirellulaceae bacterium]|jgi:hypothetical protein
MRRKASHGDIHWRYPLAISIGLIPPRLCNEIILWQARAYGGAMGARSVRRPFG